MNGKTIPDKATDIRFGMYLQELEIHTTDFYPVKLYRARFTKPESESRKHVSAERDLKIFKSVVNFVLNEIKLFFCPLLT